MDMDAARRAFALEARELLEAMEASLLEMERNGLSVEGIGAVFRAAHTIKGSSGLFGLDTMVSFTHVQENVLDHLRDGSLAFDPSMIAIFLEAGDLLGRMVGVFEQGNDQPDPDPQARMALQERFAALLDSGHAAVAEKTPGTEAVGQASGRDVAESVRRAFPVDGDDPVESDNWHISLRLAKDTFRNGLDPFPFLRHLEKLGRIVHLEVVSDTLPAFAELDPEQLYLGFEIQFDSDADRQAMESALEFLGGDSRIRILPPSSRIGQYVSLIHEDPDLVGRMGEILVACGALTPVELERALDMQVASSREQRLGEIAVEDLGVHPVVVAAALKKQEAMSQERPGFRKHQSIKVDVEKLDRLIDLVGELVIASAGAKLAAVQAKSASCEEAVNGVAALVESIRDTSLGLRMVPVGDVFDRFPRVIRDVSRELGKKIELVITGAETELDKSMVEKLTDPLMHVVRNAMDHGIEPAEARVAAGKSEVGRLHLHAFHESGSIVIEASDDGRGLDRERILAKAVARGLASPEQTYSDDDVFRFIFEAGFSTSESVTNLSGRGVGMDVVRRGIEQLRGVVELDSSPGVGSTIRFRLPLTLAIIDGFQILAGGASYVVPLELVKECSDFAPSDVQGHLVDLHGESLPFIRLRDLFRIPGEHPGRENLVVVQFGGNRLGLVVDQLAGELQAVIKPLGAMFRDLKAIGGTTILGNGTVALVIDIPHLNQVAIARESP